MSANTNSTAALLAAITFGGCFIEQLPNYKDEETGPTGVMPQIRSLVVGASTTCAVLMNRTVRCWGNALVGVGGVYGNNTLRPVEVKGFGANVEALALADGHGCVLSGGVVSCYGENDQGQVGNGAMDPSMAAALQPTIGGTGVAQLSIVQSRSGARTSSGTVLTWGAGFIGFGAVMPTPVDGVAGATDVSFGDSHNCAVTGGPVSCWGWNHGGQLGRGTVPTSATIETPAAVVNITDATQVLAGGISCVVHTGGTVSCWGMHTSTPATPTLVAGLSGVTKIVGGSQHVCALTAGSVSCWGDNTSGQLGLGTGVTSTTSPTMVPGLTDIVELAGSEYGTCARAGNGEVRCWGYNLAGDGSMMGSPVPSLVRW